MGGRWVCATACFRGVPIDVALDAIRGVGFDAIDLAVRSGFSSHFDAANSTGQERDDFVRLLRNSGLAVPAVTAAVGDFSAPGVGVGEIASLKLAALLDAASLNIDLSPMETQNGEEFQVARALKRIAQEAALLKLHLCVAVPHSKGLCRTLDQAESFLDRISEPNVYMLLDVSETRACDILPEDAVYRFAHRIGHVRLHDRRGEECFYAPGTGNVRFRRFFDALEQVNCQAYCTVGLEGDWSPAERCQTLRQAWQFLMKEGARSTGGSPFSPALG